jgi:acyl-CoA hydrolase
MLASEASLLEGASLYCMMPMGDPAYAHEPASGHISVKAFFPGTGLRSAIAADRATSLRYSLSELAHVFESGVLRADALFLQLSPPDSLGRASLGVSVDYMPSVLRQKPLVIAQINSRMPRTCGDTMIDVDIVDFYIELQDFP